MMPASKHQRRRVKRPRCVSPTHEQVIGELLRRLIDDRCLELYGKREWTIQGRDVAFEQLTDDLVREYGQRGAADR
jgi:hypothetical protein